MKPHEYVILEIARERERQMAEEGWAPEHDDKHDNDELRLAAACYALGSPDISAEVTSYTRNLSGTLRLVRSTVTRTLWPWEMVWWKPTKTRRNLVKSAALIVAEIERLDRAAKAEGGTNNG